MDEIKLKVGDIVSIAGAQWVVIYAQGSEMRLIRLTGCATAEAGGSAREGRVGNVMSIDQVAEELGVSQRAVRDYLRTGQLRGEKIGRQWRVLRSENPVLMTA